MTNLPRAIHDLSRDEDNKGSSAKKPVSSRGHAFNNGNETPSLLNQSNIYSTMNERDVEMDNLKTIIIALN